MGTEGEKGRWKLGGNSWRDWQQMGVVLYEQARISHVAKQDYATTSELIPMVPPADCTGRRVHAKKSRSERVLGPSGRLAALLVILSHSALQA